MRGAPSQDTELGRGRREAEVLSETTNTTARSRLGRHTWEGRAPGGCRPPGSERRLPFGFYGFPPARERRGLGLASPLIYRPSPPRRRGSTRIKNKCSLPIPVTPAQAGVHGWLPIQSTPGLRRFHAYQTEVSEPLSEPRKQAHKFTTTVSS